MSGKIYLTKKNNFISKSPQSIQLYDMILKY